MVFTESWIKIPKIRSFNSTPRPAKVQACKQLQMATSTFMKTLLRTLNTSSSFSWCPSSKIDKIFFQAKVLDGCNLHHQCEIADHTLMSDYLIQMGCKGFSSVFKLLSML